MSEPEHHASLLQRFGVTLVLGLTGVLALAAYSALRPESVGVPSGTSSTLLLVSVVANSLIVLVPACLLGAYTAPRVGLRVYTIDRVAAGDPIWPRLRTELKLAALVGVGGAIGVLLIDIALAPFIAAELPAATVATTQPTVVDVLLYVPVRFLYGGVTEELLLRYGLLSTLAFVGWYLRGRKSLGPSTPVMWAAILISSVLFGVGHLPALAAQVGLGPVLVARTILLNAVLGVAFGWLYWRRSLEAAMAAHIAFHVVVVALSLGQVALS